jgi:hypothetical protein
MLDNSMNHDYLTEFMFLGNGCCLNVTHLQRKIFTGFVGGKVWECEVGKSSQKNVDKNGKTFTSKP